MIRLAKLAAAAICAAPFISFSLDAGAQAYPSKPIRIVVPWAPGGSTDVLARLIGQKMTESWGQPAVVDNKPGASGNIGSDFVAKAPADGYTLLVGSVSTHAMNPFLISNMPFRGVDDFATVALAAYVTNVLAAHPSVPANNVKELIDLAKSRPGAIAYASAGNGSTNHLSAELFRRMTATDMLHVPYKGGGPATAGLLGGQVGVFFTGLGNVWDHVKSGKLKLLAVTENRRSKLLPDVPMVGETLAGYEVAVWYGVWAPAGTPADIVTRLNAEVNRIMTLADIQQRMATMGAEHVSMTVQEVGALLRGDYERWGRIIKDAGIRAD
ncbi:MAG: tripartite tricarboxylate transporter substrate binding protein [Betaproteobacteria bacterium]|nr:tripartite tricarboxylate transporter substrate binding protein [Betaproteobacteria bacterium]